jgi:hypothetical protein
MTAVRYLHVVILARGHTLTATAIGNGFSGGIRIFSVANRAFPLLPEFSGFTTFVYDFVYVGDYPGFRSDFGFCAGFAPAILCAAHVIVHAGFKTAVGQL